MTVETMAREKQQSYIADSNEVGPDLYTVRGRVYGDRIRIRTMKTSSHSAPKSSHQTVHIEARGAYMRFPPNSRGIVFHEYRTTDDGGGLATATGFGDAAFSTMEGEVNRSI